MHLYNSLSRKKEKFEPLENKTVKMYVCGITPYDTTHLGHAFTYVFFDSLKRYLEHLGYKILYTQNVTDIDDDILKRAKAENKNWEELGQFWTERFLKDMKALNVLRPDYYVKAKDSISKIIEITKELVKKGFAYERSGNVYFNVSKFKGYGRLSHFNKKQMICISKERGGYPDDPLKKNPLDFILWQKSKKGEPSWENPFGKDGPARHASRASRGVAGRPGWHIECSSMIEQYLGNRIDIHGGGRDLIFPHHESEIAQSESYTGKVPFVKYWLHTSMVLYEGEKMSKSLGNLIMISDLLKRFSPNVIRFVLLSHHYRLPWEFEDIELKTAHKNIKLIEKALNLKPDLKMKKIKDTYFKKFESFMNNDMDTTSALINATHTTKKIIRYGKIYDVSQLQKSLRKMLKVLGFVF